MAEVGKGNNYTIRNYTMEPKNGASEDDLPILIQNKPGKAGFFEFTDFQLIPILHQTTMPGNARNELYS